MLYNCIAKSNVIELKWAFTSNLNAYSTNIIIANRSTGHKFAVRWMKGSGSGIVRMFNHACE